MSEDQNIVRASKYPLDKIFREVNGKELRIAVTAPLKEMLGSSSETGTRVLAQ